ncbi:MAG TPA: hypothetical protein ENG87_01265 [Candidatus Pacearchaeota archaeon]|nr:hypothetical protein BMS3Abin17_00584 [archaeon BMS3Abin17]HDK41980.1 hypothetical protein [Candidatus Pacearchaeota archaeon]HDZ60350.1 hypothetical protein [Candidatus Pacearchaeota archaeon]
MPTQDTSKIKEKIFFVIRQKGPSLPVHIARETGLSMLFSSAFLSELVSEEKIKISNMRVGNSPIYFIPGQEKYLEKFSEHLKSKEKEAFLRLKEKKFLRDEIQEPAIRVALRSIKDFAIPFKSGEIIFWRYFTIPESELVLKQKQPQKPSETKKETQPGLDIFDKTKTPKAKKISKKKVINKKPGDKFFNKVKEFLSRKLIEISDIDSFSKNEITLRVRISGRENLLFAYNKKRVNEEDIVKAYKKASQLNLPYSILSLGEPLKKLENLIEAVKTLERIGKIE